MRWLIFCFPAGLRDVERSLQVAALCEDDGLPWLRCDPYDGAAAAGATAGAREGRRRDRGLRRRWSFRARSWTRARPEYDVYVPVYQPEATPVRTADADAGARVRLLQRRRAVLPHQEVSLQEGDHPEGDAESGGHRGL